MNKLQVAACHIFKITVCEMFQAAADFILNQSNFWQVHKILTTYIAQYISESLRRKFQEKSFHRGRKVTALKAWLDNDIYGKQRMNWGISLNLNIMNSHVSMDKIPHKFDDADHQSRWWWWWQCCFPISPYHHHYQHHPAVCKGLTVNEICLCLCYRLFVALIKCPKKDHSILIIIMNRCIQQCARVWQPMSFVFVFVIVSSLLQ